MARHGALAELDEANDLVIIELDHVPPLSVRSDREAFEDQFAQLAFGLGTVRRRVHADRASRTPLWLLLFAVGAMFAVLVGNPGPSVSSSAAPAALPMLEASTAAQVVNVAFDRIEAVHVDTRAQHIVRLTGIPDGIPTAVAPGGDGFAAIVGGRAWGVSRALDRPAIDLGPSDVLFPAADRSWVWIGVATSEGWRLHRVSPVTGAIGPVLLAPVGNGAGRPIGVLDGDGPVLDRVVDGTRLVASDTTSRLIPRRDIVLGLVDTSVATLRCDRHGCAVVLTDLEGRGDRTIDTPVPAGWTLGPSAVGVANGEIAALTNPPGSEETRVLVVRHGAARVIDAGGHATALAWGGDWLFVSLDDGRLVAIGPTGGPATVDIAPMPQGALIGS